MRKLISFPSLLVSILSAKEKNQLEVSHETKAYITK